MPGDRKPVAADRRRYRVDYDLAYDGGGARWTGYYRFATSARLAMVWNRWIASWGGTAILHDSRQEREDTNAG